MANQLTPKTSEVISKKNRIELREHLVTSFTLRYIEKLFDGEDIFCDLDYDPQLSGQRRTLVEQYYHSMDFTSWEDVQKFLRIFEIVIDDLSQDQSPFSGRTEDKALLERKRLLNYIKQDGFVYENNRLSMVSPTNSLEHAKRMTFVLDAAHIHQQIKRMEGAIDTDPELAIGTAKEFVESISKTILKERNALPDSKKLDVRDLVKACLKELNLVPDDIPERAKGAESIKLLLSNLGTIVDRIDTLRGLYGTGHGKDSDHKGLSSRHARLMVGAASTLGLFLFETHQEKS
jgi:hypothetical protein